MDFGFCRMWPTFYKNQSPSSIVRDDRRVVVYEKECWVERNGRMRRENEDKGAEVMKRVGGED